MDQNESRVCLLQVGPALTGECPAAARSSLGLAKVVVALNALTASQLLSELSAVRVVIRVLLCFVRSLPLRLSNWSDGVSRRLAVLVVSALPWRIASQ